MKDTVYFLSDAHLGAQVKNCDERENHLITFLRSVRNSASHLFIVGDLFDFWIEYRHAIRPVYFTILHEFKLLIENGTRIYYLSGNHDFALGSFLQDTVGIHICPDHFDITLQKKKIHLYHGDGILKSDFGYRLWRRVLRNPVNQKLYRCLHPNIGVPLATVFSGSSRYFLKNRWNEKKRGEYVQAARHHLDSGADIAIMGHTHLAEIYDLDGKIYCNTGEWLRTYNYAKLKEGTISLWEHLPGQSPASIEPVSLK